MTSQERESTKAYKNREFLLGKWDLNPAIDEPSPLDINDALLNGRYHAGKEADIKSKLENALRHAEDAQQLFGGPAAAAPGDNHQLRIDTYRVLLAGVARNW